MSITEQLAQRLRDQCTSLRRKPTPLADLIPLLQEAADALRAQPAAEQAAGQIDPAAGVAWQAGAWSQPKTEVMVDGKRWYREDHPRFAASPSHPQPAPQAEAVASGYALVRTPIDEAMHVAAAKVLARSSGLDGTPQRMLDAMIAAQPAAGRAVGLVPLSEREIAKINDEYGFQDGFIGYARAIEKAHGIRPAGSEGEAS